MTTALDTATLLEAAMTRLGVRSEPGYYLFEAYDEVPDGLPLLQGVDDWMGAWCYACAEALLDAARMSTPRLGNLLSDTSPQCCIDSEGPCWCPRCGVYLAIGYTWCSVEGELAHCHRKRLCPEDLPSIVEALGFYGSSNPHHCRACRCNSRVSRRWQAPAVTVDSARWQATAFRRVAVPCTHCLAPVPLDAREAVEVIDGVRRWRRLQALARRAVRQFVTEEDRHAV